MRSDILVKLEAAIMDVSCLVYDNKSEGGRKTCTLLQKQDEYSPVFFSNYATSQPHGHWNWSGGNLRSQPERKAGIVETGQPREGQETQATAYSLL